MYAIEFEADIKNGTVKIPDMYRRVYNSHARIILMVNDESVETEESAVGLDFSNTEIKAFSGRDAVAIQRTMRDEW